MPFNTEEQNNYKQHPALEYWVANFGEPVPIALENFHNIVDCFFSEAQKPFAEQLTEEQKRSLLRARGRLAHNDQLINYLNSIENQIVNAHRLPYPDNSVINLDAGIRTANRLLISTYVRLSDTFRDELLEEITQYCELSNTSEIHNCPSA